MKGTLVGCAQKLRLSPHTARNYRHSGHGSEENRAEEKQNETGLISFNV